MNTVILVPVFNEGVTFLRWFPRLRSVAEKMKAEIIVVDDGSQQRLQLSGVVLLRHQVNCGAGAAVMTGISYARENGAERVFTIDGDGQHDPEDLLRLNDALEQGQADLVNGSRFLMRQPVPLSRRIGNAFANVLTFFLSGFWLTDSQSGMKGFSQKALEHLDLRSAGYEWCTEVFREANWYRWHTQEVPISVRYTPYSLQKGQCFAVGMDMVIRLVARSLLR